MQCEVCGRRIIGKSYKAIIEGARLVVCGECAMLGSISWEIKTPKPRKRPGKLRKLLGRKSRVSSRPQSPLEPALELVEDFGTRIRQAREAENTSLEELGRRINEKVSVLKKLESNKMAPDNNLAEKLQHVLKIKLLVPTIEGKIPKQFSTLSSKSQTVTLGDLVRNKKKPSEGTK